LNARGSLKVAEAQLGGLTFENVALELNAANGDLRIHPISASFFEGTYKGDVRINVAGKVPVLTVNESISNVQLAPLALAMFEQENITGEINGTFKLTGRGQDLNAMQRGLNGSMSFELLDGAFEGTDVWHELRRARAMLKQEAPPEPALPARTKFSSISASGVVTDGVFNNNDLVADIPFMRLTGNGSVDLAEASLDYRMTARVLERPEFEQGASNAELDEFTGAVIPLRITGPLSSPSVKPDIANLLKKEIEKEVKKRLTDLLLGDRDDSDAGGADGDTEEEAAEEEKLEDIAKKALFDLLKN
jgi:AsmA protein